MNDFLRNAHAADADMPTDVRALEDAVGVRLVVADRTDPEDVGFVEKKPFRKLLGFLSKLVFEYSMLPRRWVNREHLLNYH